MMLNKNRKKGFTLVELMVAVFVFSLIAGTIANIFISSIETQKKILKDQKIISELSYVMEYASRALRMAKKDYTGACLGAGFQEYNYRLMETDPDSGGEYGPVIRFLSYNDKCQEIGLDSNENRIYEKKSTDETANNLSSELYITSSNILVDQLYFHKTGSSWGPVFNNHPKIMINLGFMAINDNSSVILQTIVSQRNY